MLFSLIIPTYNRIESVLRLLDSISFLGDNFQKDNFEIIILNDGGSELLEKNYFIDLNFQIKLINNIHNRGRAAIRNQGANLARGEILFFIDDDLEIKDQEIFEKHLRQYSLNRADSVFSNVIYIAGTKTSAKNLNKYMNKRGLIGRPDGKIEYGNYFLTGFCSVKKDLFKKMNGFDANFRGYGWEDPEFGMMLEKKGSNIWLIKSKQLLHHHNKPIEEYAAQMISGAKNFSYLIEKHPVLYQRFRLALFKKKIMILIFNKFFYKFAIFFSSTFLYYFAIRYIFLYAIFVSSKEVPKKYNY